MTGCVSVAVRLSVYCEFTSEDVGVDFVVGAWDVGETGDVAFCAFLVDSVLVTSGVGVDSVKFAVLVDVGDEVGSLEGSGINPKIVSRAIGIDHKLLTILVLEDNKSISLNGWRFQVFFLAIGQNSIRSSFSININNIQISTSIGIEFILDSGFDESRVDAVQRR